MLVNLWNIPAYEEIINKNKIGRLQQVVTGIKGHYRTRVMILEKQVDVRIGTHFNQMITHFFHFKEDFYCHFNDRGIISNIKIKRPFFDHFYYCEWGEDEVKLRLFSRKTLVFNGQIYFDLAGENLLDSTGLFLSFLGTYMSIFDNYHVHWNPDEKSVASIDYDKRPNYQGPFSNKHPYNIFGICLGMERIEYSKRDIYMRKLKHIDSMNVPWKNLLLTGFEYFYGDKFSNPWQRYYKVTFFFTSDRTMLFDDEDFFVMESLMSFLDHQICFWETNTSDYAFLNSIGIAFLFSSRFNLNLGLKFNLILNIDFFVTDKGRFRFRFGPDLYLRTDDLRSVLSYRIRNLGRGFRKGIDYLRTLGSKENKKSQPTPDRTIEEDVLEEKLFLLRKVNGYIKTTEEWVSWGGKKVKDGYEKTREGTSSSYNKAKNGYEKTREGTSSSYNKAKNGMSWFTDKGN